MVHYSGKGSLGEEQKLQKGTMRPAMAAQQEITAGESWTLFQIIPVFSLIKHRPTSAAGEHVIFRW